jgi:hypothetical protein
MHWVIELMLHFMDYYELISNNYRRLARTVKRQTYGKALNHKGQKDSSKDQGFLKVHGRVIARRSLPKQSPMLPQGGDCFVAKNAPRSDVQSDFLDFKKALLKGYEDLQSELKPEII